MENCYADFTVLSVGEITLRVVGITSRVIRIT